jgi:hypothetical protein
MPALTGGAALVGATFTDPASGKSARGLLRIDTGDDISITDPSIIAATGAQPTGSAMVQGVFGQPVPVPQYTLDVALDTGGVLEGVTVLGSPTGQLGYGGLLGVNELKQAVFVYDGPSGWFDLYVPGSQPVQEPSSSDWILYGSIAAVLVGLASIAVGVAVERAA